MLYNCKWRRRVADKQVMNQSLLQIYLKTCQLGLTERAVYGDLLWFSSAVYPVTKCSDTNLFVCGN
jgi:hypothetical protein